MTESRISLPEPSPPKEVPLSMAKLTKQNLYKARKKGINMNGAHSKITMDQIIIAAYKEIIGEISAKIPEFGLSIGSFARYFLIS